MDNVFFDVIGDFSTLIHILLKYYSPKVHK